MCGTRSTSPKEPATEAQQPALLIVAHGERGGERTNLLPMHIADLARRSGRYSQVETGFIRSRPGVEEAASLIKSDRLVVYPLFMSDGYYVRRAIPEQLGLNKSGSDRWGRQVEVLQPPGISALFPASVGSIAGGAAARAGHDASGCHLLLVAHGSSKSASSRLATESVRNAVELDGEFAGVHIALLEEEPGLNEQLRKVPGPLIVIGLFAGEGMHGAEDMAQAVGASDRADLILADPLPRSGHFMHLIAKALDLEPT